MWIFCRFVDFYLKLRMGSTDRALLLAVVCAAGICSAMPRMAEEQIPKAAAVAVADGDEVGTTAPVMPTTAPSICWTAQASDCPNGSAACARSAFAPSSLLCCNVDSSRLKDAFNAEVQNVSKPPILSVHVINATLDELDVSSSTWRRLMSIVVTDGQINKVTGEFRKHSSAACLNLSNNAIANIEPRALVNLFNLTTLDLSHNNLEALPHFGGQRAFALDITGNNEMLCRSVLDALTRHGGHLNFINANSTFCRTSKTFHWFNTTELLPIRQVEFIHELKSECSSAGDGLANCSCDFVRLDIMPGRPPTQSVGVDCSNRKLHQLPARLPPHTVELNVSHNMITSLAPMSDDLSYENLRQLDADYNNIQSLVELEGTKFIDNFAILSLRANKLKTLPTYILSNIFSQTWSQKNMYLAYNQLHCDCNTAKVLKVWLLSKSKNVPDYDELMCENTGGKVIDLVEAKMCQQQRDWTDYIYYVIAGELLLLIGLVAKVSYDYWVFKTAGYLPWPASKMPKLPCDWLCE